MGRCWREFLLPLYLALGLAPLLKRDPSMPDKVVDLGYLADNLWFVGSPGTVASRINDLQQWTGGFGYLVIASYDAVDEREWWERSLRLLVNEVGNVFKAPALPRERQLRSDCSMRTTAPCWNATTQIGLKETTRSQPATRCGESSWAT
jgi:hypothetical protein